MSDGNGARARDAGEPLSVPREQLPDWLPEPAEVDDLKHYASADCSACHGLGWVDDGPCYWCIVEVFG